MEKCCVIKEEPNCGNGIEGRIIDDSEINMQSQCSQKCHHFVIILSSFKKCPNFIFF